MNKYFLFYLFFFASSSTYAQNAEWRHIHQGNRAFVKGDYKTAEFEYRAAQKLNPQSARAAFNLGDVYLAQRNMQAALEQYQVAASLAASTAPSSWFSPSVITTMALPTFLLLLKLLSANLMAAPRLVP